MNQDNYNKELQHLECMHFYSYASHGTWGKEQLKMLKVVFIAKT